VRIKPVMFHSQRGSIFYCPFFGYIQPAPFFRSTSQSQVEERSLIMSLLTAQEFLECLERDPKLQKQFALAAPANVVAILDFAAHHGYHFSPDEFTVALQAFPKSRLAQDYAGPKLRISPYERERHSS